MPFGGTTPEQDKKIDDCIKGVTGTNKRTGKPYTESEKIAICKAAIMNKAFLFSEITQVKSEGEEYYIEGIASSSNPDLGNDIVADSALNQMADVINKAYAEGRPLPLGYEHTEILGGHPHIVPLGQVLKAWVDTSRLFIKGSLNKALSVFNEAKAALERKDLHSLSIEYIPEEASLQSGFVNGVKCRIINAMKALVGMGITGRPMNADSVVQFYAKNLDFMISTPEVQAKMEHDDEEMEKRKKKMHEDKLKENMEEKKMETAVQEKKSEGVNEPLKFEVSSEQYKMLQEFEAKAAEEKTTSKFAEVAKKIYQEMQASKGPVIGSAEKFDAATTAPLPDEVKNYLEVVESKTARARDKWKAAGELHTWYLGNGVEIKSSPMDTIITRAAANKRKITDYTGVKINEVERGKDKFEFKNLVQLKAELQTDTNKVTSGSTYYQSAAELNDIYGPAIISHLNELHTTYGLLRKVDASDYGENYGFRFKRTRSSSAETYDEGAADPTAQVTTRNKALIPFMFYRSTGQVSGPLVAAASGRGGIGDVYAEEVKDQTEALLNKINTDIFDSSTPASGMTKGGQIMSLRWMCDDATTHTTLYGHDRSAGNFTTLQGTLTAKSSSPFPAKEDLRKMWTDGVNNGANKDDLVYVTSFTQFRKLMGTMDDAQRFVSTNLNAGFVGPFSFDGIPILPDTNCDAGFIYCLDTQHTFIAQQLSPMIDELAKTGDFRKFSVKAYLALLSTAPNHNSLMTGFNTS